MCASLWIALDLSLVWIEIGVGLDIYCVVFKVRAGVSLGDRGRWNGHWWVGKSLVRDMLVMDGI